MFGFLFCFTDTLKNNCEKLYQRISLGPRLPQYCFQVDLRMLKHGHPLKRGMFPILKNNFYYSSAIEKISFWHKPQSHPSTHLLNKYLLILSNTTLGTL